MSPPVFFADGDAFGNLNRKASVIYIQIHTHIKIHTQQQQQRSPIWREAAFRSRWRLHVSTAKGATGLQQTSVLVVVVVVGEDRRREGRGVEGLRLCLLRRCFSYLSETLRGIAGDHVIHH